MRYAAIIILLLGVVIPFEVRANTLIIVLRIGGIAVLAADSQVADDDGLPNGSTCKINVTNNHVFAIAGIIREGGGPLNVRATAETAIRAGGTLEEIASKFEDALADELKGFLSRFKTNKPEQYARAFQNHQVVVSVFFEKTNFVTTTFYLPNRDFPQTIEIIRHACPGDCPVDGPLLFAFGDNGAVTAEIDRPPNIWEAKTIIPRMNYLMEIQHRATPNTVGPPVSIIAMDQTGDVQWKQKGKCD